MNPHIKSARKWMATTLIPLLLLSTMMISCGSRRAPAEREGSLKSMSLIDRNGLSETLTSKDRLKKFESTDFLSPQPYQKVLRTFTDGGKENTRSEITAYHPNGQISHQLQARNGRAMGIYREWFPNGQRKLESFVIGGMADLTPAAEQSWLFDGKSKAWNEEGQLLAEISYKKGALDGISTYYHANGRVWKQVPYEEDLIHGELSIYLDNGDLFSTAQYLHGEKHGPSYRYYNPKKIAFEERYEHSKLQLAKYYTSTGDLISEIKEGNGFRAILGKSHLHELQQFQEGIQEGEVKEFDDRGNIVRKYSIKNDVRHGTEFEYNCTNGKSNQPKIEITWYNGAVQGLVKTWYPNGLMESQKEMSNNKRHGLNTAWFEDGSLMMIEEYENDLLVRGEYHRKGETAIASKVERGKGIASLFDSNGGFLQKVKYDRGLPIVD
jgi:antitoxin component YwqK of YwqJK toxin-antitoxin module